MEEFNKPNEGPSNCNAKQYDIGEFLQRFNDDISPQWMDNQNAQSLSQMKHWIGLSFLMEDRFKVEREQYFSELNKRYGKIESPEDAENFIAYAQTLPLAGSIFRATSPGASRAAEDYIKAQDIDSHLEKAGISLQKITPLLRENLNICHAYSRRTAGDKAGSEFFAQQLGAVKDSLIKGLGDRRVTLALAGAMLGVSVVAAAGPLGVVVSGVRFGHQLLKTEQGAEFQKGFVAACKSFLKGIGVSDATLDQVKNTVTEAWDRTAGTKWGRTALVGVGIAASVGAVSAISISQIAEIVNEGRLSFDVAEVYASATDAIDQTGMSGPEVETKPTFSILAGTQETIGVLTEEGSAIPSGEHNGLPDGDAPQAPVFHDYYVNGVGADVKMPCYAPDNFTAAVDTQGARSSIESGLSAPFELPAPILCDVEAGDTLWEIAERHYLAAHPGGDPTPIELANIVNDIAGMNEIEDPDLIFEGQTLSLPTDVNPDKQVVLGRVDWLDGGRDASNSLPVSEDAFQRQPVANTWVSPQSDPADASRMVAVKSKGMSI